MDINKLLLEDERIEKIESLMKDYGIAHLRDTKGISLSGGERRRVEIARTPVRRFLARWRLR